MLVDTHAHLTDERLARDLDGVLARAAEAGVGHVVTIGTDWESSLRAVEIARGHDAVSAVVGVHPHDASAADRDLMQRLAGLAREPEVVGIGETGLDYYRDLSPRGAQRKAFEAHLDLALELGLPVVVHCREAWDECLEILEGRSAAGLRGVAHCFSGDETHAARLRATGFLVSFAGNITYAKADRLRQVAAKVSAEQVLVETDCPYLAPEPFRGRTCEPAFVKQVAAELARVYALTEEDVARVTSYNAHRLFGVGESPRAGAVVYEIRGALYLNLTNRCSNACRFCPRETTFAVKGHDLRLEKDPSVEEVIAAIGDPSPYSEIVFCGFGEPTLRLEDLKRVARWVKERAPGKRVRLNTNGQGSLVNGRPICAELKGLVDSVSISLNAADRETYVPMCRPSRGPEAYDAVLAFIEEARDTLPEVTVTTLDMPGGDVEACRRVAERLRVPLRVRKYDDVGTLR